MNWSLQYERNGISLYARYGPRGFWDQYGRYRSDSYIRSRPNMAHLEGNGVEWLAQCPSLRAKVEGAIKREALSFKGS